MRGVNFWIKTDVISVRPFKSDIQYLRSKAQTRQVKISVMVRELLHRGVELEREASAIQAYKAGKVSLREAAKKAGVCPREMMDILVRNGVRFGDIRIEVNEELKKVEAALEQ